MPEAPAYVILGRGRWAARVQQILAVEGRRTVPLAETRQGQTEDSSAYTARLAEAMHKSCAQIAWLCVLPGPHIVLMIEAAVHAGLHVIAEKPWLCSAEITDSLKTKARAMGKLVGIHYEYCLLDAVGKWRANYDSGAGLRFAGRFFLSRKDHTGMHPMDNLGSHLLAIRAYATPRAAVQAIVCGYERPDERCVWLEKGSQHAAFLNLLENREPIIQRYIQSFEAAAAGAGFPFGLDFAMRVSEDVAALK
ncbi:MAG TPA: hypothetical protein VJN42_03130 [Candidatus Acidoferrum sp.]|nr:hypothetical protein [Candidatus Acidoferrum sp.]